MNLTIQQQTDHARLLEMMEAWRQAVRSKDIEALMEHYAPDSVTFDAWGDLACPIDVYRQHWEMCFQGHKDPIGIEHHDVHLSVGDRVAFCRCLIHMFGELQNDQKNDFRGRGTICFEKINDRWLVTHEHASVPFDPMTNQACTNLTPNR